MVNNFSKKRKVLAAILTVLAALFVVSLSLFFYQKAYASKIYKNVFYGDLNLSGKTKTQATSIIENQTHNQLQSELTIKNSDGSKEAKYQLGETGGFVYVDQIVDELYSTGRDKNFFKQIYFSAKTILSQKVVAEKLEFDKQTYDNFVAKVSEALSIQPLDANISINSGKVVVTTPQNGLTVDASKLQDDIAARYIQNETEYLIEIPTVEITPNLATDDLKDAQSKAESYLNHTVQIVYNGETTTFDKATIGSWINFPNENGKITAKLSSDAIKSSISKYASKIDTPVINKKISAVDETQVIQEGRTGIYIDQNDALSKVLAGFAGSTTSIIVQAIIYNKDPEIIKVFPDEGIVPGRYSGQYIDVDVTKQLMTLFNGATQVAQYTVSTGKASTPTPLGVRTIEAHTGKTWSASAGLWMPWFMSLGGGYGIHELPEWPNGYKEGEAHLGTPVSHGCIRLGVGSAEMVYNWTPDGTPVYIHK